MQIIVAFTTRAEVRQVYCYISLCFHPGMLKETDWKFLCPFVSIIYTEDYCVVVLFHISISINQSKNLHGSLG